MKNRARGQNSDLQPNDKTSSQQRRIFWLVLAFIPPFLLITAEIILRSINYGGNLDLVVRKIVHGKEYYTLNREVARRYFSQKGIGIPEAYDDIFEIHKSLNTKRIFMLGESTMAGYPFDYNATAPRLLQDRLRQLLPQYNIEVINVGLAAINSYTVLDFIKELVNYQPDAFIVYLGHNEFYGAFGIGSTEYLGQWRSLINIYLAMRKVRLFLLIRDGVVGLRNVIKPDVTPRDATLMEVMVREKAIPYRSKDYRIARQNFEANLRSIIEVSQSNNIPIILSTLASNIRDQKPLLATFNEQTTPEDKVLWENLVEHGDAAFAIGNFPDAQRCFREAIQIDSMNASAHFSLAQCLDTLGNFIEAQREYEKARDYDGLRFRASSDFNALIRDVCRQENAILADIERLLQEHSPRGLVGRTLMFEHLHPNFGGYFLIAKGFFQTLLKHDLVVKKSEWQRNRDLSDAEFKHRSGVTDLT